MAWPDPEFGNLMEAKLMELLGDETRLAGRVNGVDGLWIRFEMQDEPYWMLLDPERLARQANRNWIDWFSIALALALAASLAISRVINRPLASLAGAIDRVSRGETHAGGKRSDRTGPHQPPLQCDGRRTGRA